MKPLSERYDKIVGHLGGIIEGEDDITAEEVAQLEADLAEVEKENYWMLREIERVGRAPKEGW